MKTFLEWLKPGVRIKRYIILQLISIGTLVYSIISLTTREILVPKILIAYISLIAISLFFTVYSFFLAQRNILKVSLNNIAYKNKDIDIRKLLYTENMLKKGPKVVIIGGGKGLSNILSGLKEFTANISLIVSTFNDEDLLKRNTEELDTLPPSDIRRSIIALSEVEPCMENLLGYKLPADTIANRTLGNVLISALIETLGGFAPAVQNIASIFNVKGKILPVTLEPAKLCAGLENGEIVVGQANIRQRILESKSRIKQVFLKDVEAVPSPGVLEAINDADVIVLGPGSLYTGVICNLLVSGVCKAITQSKAKKLMIANLMNEPGETAGYTLAKHINEMERYLGKHVIDYVIANNGEITEDMIYDFNQGASTPVTIDLPNIQNRTISVIEEDLVITAPNAILHDNVRVSEIIVDIAKAKKSGKLNLLKSKNKNKKQNKNNIKAESAKESKKNKAKKEDETKNK